MTRVGMRNEPAKNGVSGLLSFVRQSSTSLSVHSAAVVSARFASGF